MNAVISKLLVVRPFCMLGHMLVYARVMLVVAPQKWYLGARGGSQLFKASKILRIGALQLELSSFYCGASEIFELVRATYRFLCKILTARTPASMLDGDEQ